MLKVAEGGLEAYEQIIFLRNMMQIIQKIISLENLKTMSNNAFGGIVKAVVDVEKGIMGIDADLHADIEKLLLEQESQQGNLWGINLHPTEFGKDAFVEFDSMINMRPSWGNRSRGVDDPCVQEQIKKVINKLVTP